MKPLNEITAEDVPDLIKNDMRLTLQQLIEMPNKDPKLANALITNLFDRSGRKVERVYEQMRKDYLASDDKTKGPFVTPLQYNMMIRAASNFTR